MKKFKEFEIKGNDIHGGCARCESNAVKLCGDMSSTEAQFVQCMANLGYPV